MPTNILLLHVNICQRGHHFSLVMNGVKITEEAHAWVPGVCPMVQVVYIDHNLCSLFAMRLLLQQCAPLFCCCMFIFHHLSLVMYGVKMTEEAHVFMGTSSVSNGRTGLY
jgi:hypothetical protein